MNPVNHVVNSNGGDFEKEVSFFKAVVLDIQDDVHFRICNPWPSNLDDLQIRLPAEAGVIESYFGQKTDRDTALQSLHFLKKAFLKLIADPQPYLLQSVLTVGELYKKIFAVCDEKFVDKAVSQYHVDERELGMLQLPDLTLEQRIISSILGPAPTVDQCIEAGQFGPGACAERLNATDRWSAPMSPDQAYMMPPKMLIDLSITFSDDRNARMIAVPKTATKPRLIAAEPAWNMFIQQGIAHYMSNRMCRFKSLDTRNPDRNGRLCADPSLATIDQSRASDRVSWALVRELLPLKWVELLDLCRTPAIDCLCGKTHTLEKYAGMGSATTFPVETLVFAVIAVCAFCHTKTDALSALRSESVGAYGDDLVIPCDSMDTVEDRLRSCGFVINSEKSYSSPGFRESCGVYRSEGYDVTPLRRHFWLPLRKDDANSLGLLSFVNSFSLWHDATRVRAFCNSYPVADYRIDLDHPKLVLSRNARGFGLWGGPAYTTNFSTPVKASVKSVYSPARPDSLADVYRSLWELDHVDDLMSLDRKSRSSWQHPRPIRQYLKF